MTDFQDNLATMRKLVIKQWNARLKALRHSVPTRAAAARRLVQEDPQLHERYLKAANVDRPRSPIHA